jgi:hypothetical protein
MQSQPEIARKFGIPDWKIEERIKAVADPSRYAGLKKGRRGRCPDRFGTDAGSPAVEHDVIAPELAHMVKVGVCPDNMDALASITIRAARLSKMDHLIGTLEVGKAGDVIVVDGNPDEDLFALERVRHDLRRRQEDARMSLLRPARPPHRRGGRVLPHQDARHRGGDAGVIALGRGDPDFHTPAHIVDAAKAALDANAHHYTGPTGLPALRRPSPKTCTTATGSTTPPMKSWSRQACRKASC